MRAVRRSHAYDAFWAEIILEVLSRSKLSPSMACMKTRHCLFKVNLLPNQTCCFVCAKVVMYCVPNIIPYYEFVEGIFPFDL